MVERLVPDVLRLRDPRPRSPSWHDGPRLEQLPPAFDPSEATAHGRFTERTAARVWAKFSSMILDETRLAR
jgi:hypothetical protein